LRKPPKDEQGKTLTPPVVKSRFLNEMVSCVRRYKLLTPLFGGGVVSGKADPITIIRGSSIRGQLRFWWRACRGGKFDGDLKEMKKYEDTLWGAAGAEKQGLPSQVQIKMGNAKKGKEIQPFERRGRPADDWSILSYAAFPLQESQGSVMDGVTFELTISYPKTNTNGMNIGEEVAAALWAWETFGGIGARTRRGFGALHCLDGPVLPTDTNRVKQSLKAGLLQHVVEGAWPQDVPYLNRDGKDLKVIGVFSDPQKAWEKLISELRRFRQSREGGRGPSLWPEPDEIRRLFKKNSDQRVAKFPRAYFGLPIVFHFKDDYPDDTILEGKEYSRRASPLILRPLACDQDKAVGLALILGGRQLPPGGLVLKSETIQPEAQAKLTTAEAEEILPLDGNPDVLDAFLKTLN